MKMMKKLTALLIALTATLSFATTAACGGNKPSSEESSSETPSTNTAWGEWEAVTQPSCTTAGSKIRFSLEDETISETAPIPARGHDYSGENTTCIRCAQQPVIPSLDANQQFPLVETCTHTDLEIYEDQCDCAYKGRGEEYSRLQLSEGCYTVETVSNGEVTNAIWLSFSVKEAGQYMLYICGKHCW